jgi:hypothetical protein
MMLGKEQSVHFLQDDAGKGAVCTFCTGWCWERSSLYNLYRMMLGREQSVHFVQDDAGKGTVAGKLALWIFLVKRDKLDVQGIYISILNYLLTYSMEQSPSWDAKRFSSSQENIRIYGTGWFISAFTRARHLSLSWASSIQSVPPPPTSWRSILILSSYLRAWVFQVVSFPSGFPPVYISLHIRATYHAHLILLDFIIPTILGEEYWSLSSSLRSFLHSPHTSFLLDPNILSVVK